MNRRHTPEPVAGLRKVAAYAPDRTLCPTDLRLDGNEGRAPAAALLARLAAGGPECLRRYPDRGPLDAP